MSRPPGRRSCWPARHCSCRLRASWPRRRWRVDARTRPMCER